MASVLHNNVWVWLSKWNFSFWRNIVSEEADWTSSCRVLQSGGPAVENEQSPTVTSHEGRMARSLEVDDRSRLLEGRSVTWHSRSNSCLLIQTTKFNRDTYIWFDIRRISGDRLTFFINEKLCEIPLDEATTPAMLAILLDTCRIYWHHPSLTQTPMTAWKAA